MDPGLAHRLHLRRQRAVRLGKWRFDQAVSAAELIYEPASPIREDDAGVIEVRDLTGQLVRGPGIVPFDNSQQRSRGRLQGREVEIAQVLQPPVFASDDPDAWVPVAARDIGGAIRGAVVDDDQLPGHERLGQDAFHRRADEGRMVVRRHDRGNDRLARHLVHHAGSINGSPGNRRRARSWPT